MDKWIAECEEVSKRRYRCNLNLCQLVVYESGEENEWQLTISKNFKMLGCTFYTLNSKSLEKAIKEAEDIAFLEFVEMKNYYHELADAMIG